MHASPSAGAQPLWSANVDMLGHPALKRAPEAASPVDHRIALADSVGLLNCSPGIHEQDRHGICGA